MEDIKLQLYFYEFIEMANRAMSQEQALEMIKEIDAYWGSYEFTHKLLEYVLSIINEDPMVTNSGLKI